MLNRVGWSARLVMWSFGALLAIELILRLALGSPDATAPDPVLGTRLLPDRALIESREGYSRNRVGPDGTLDEGRDPAASARVVVIGDSYVEARHVPLERRFTELIEARRDGLDVVNAGFAGRTPAHYALWLRERHADFRPDLAVIALNDRDLDELLNSGVVRFERVDDGRYVLAAGTFRAVPDSWIRRAMAHSSLVTWTVRRARLLLREESSRLRRRIAPPVVAAATDSTRSIDDLVARLHGMHRALVETGVEFAYVHIPRIDYLGDGAVRMDPMVHTVYARFAREAGVGLVDPFPAFVADFERTGQPLHGFHNLRMGEGHLNDAGHRVLAEVLGSVITERLR